MNVVVLVRLLRAAPEGPPAERALGVCEEAALSLACALRGAAEKGQVVALAAGPADREDAALQRALALGADRAIRVDDGGLLLDAYGVARLLAPAVRRTGFDLVLAGDRSEDEGPGALGPAVAEALALPHLTGVLAARADGTGMVATRRDAGFLRSVRLERPALLTVASFRGPAPSRHGETTTAIEVLSPDELGVSLTELRHRERCVGRPSRMRSRPIVPVTPEALVVLLRAEPPAGAGDPSER